MGVPLSVEEARERVLEGVEPLPPIELPLLEAHGCVVAADVVAEGDLPPFSSAVADGFALRAADVHAAGPESPVALRLAGRGLAGRPPEATVGWGEAVRVGAGAPVPAGADAVVPPADCELDGETVRVRGPAEAGEGVRPAAEDVRAGDVLVPKGRRLSAAELGVLAAAGRASALAHPKLRVAVAASGDLVEPGQAASIGRVVDAASYALVGALRDAGAVPYRVGVVREDEDEVREAVVSNLGRADAFLRAGAGADPGVLGGGLGKVEALLVAMEPGGGLEFGLLEGMPYVGLPGAAAAALIAFEVLVRPMVLKMMGRADLRRPEISAVLGESVGGPPGVTLFVPVRVERAEGEWRARPTGRRGAGLGAASRANGLAVVPPRDAALPAGEQVRVQVSRALEG